LINSEECPGDVSGAVSLAEADQFLETTVAATEKEAETNQPEGTEDLVCSTVVSSQLLCCLI